MVPWFGPFVGIEIAVCGHLTSEEAALTTVCMQWTAQEASFDRLMHEMLSPATVWRAPRFATEGGWLATGVVQYAILVIKEAEFGCQSELVATRRCEFSEGKTNDSIVFA